MSEEQEPPKNQNSKPKGLGLYLFLVAWVWCYSSVPDIGSIPIAGETVGTSEVVYIIAQDWVKQRLEAPSTAAFPRIFERGDHVRTMPNNQYGIDSWVYAENELGAMTQTHFNAVIEQTGEHQWRLVSLALDE